MQIGQFTDNARSPIIAFDFDGTITQENTYPHCGQLRKYVKEVFDMLYKHGVKIVVWTCRETNDKNMIQFLCNNDIVYHAINSSIEFAPFDYESRKIYAHMYVDDRAFGFDENDEEIMIKIYVDFMSKNTNRQYTDILHDVNIIKYGEYKDMVDRSLLSLPHIFYTDGGCWCGNRIGAWAYIELKYRNDDKPIRLASQSCDDTTNNRMELTAAIEAIKSTPHGSTVTIYTDSGYVAKGFHDPSYLAKWCKNGWKATKGSVSNIDLWKIILKLMDNYTIKFILLAGGHGKDPDPINVKWNNMVDKMCSIKMRERLEELK